MYYFKMDPEIYYKKSDIQVVIAIGGRGSRVEPISNYIPKPFIKVQGKPFIFYLIEQFCESGFSNFLFLLGHKSNIAESYLKNYNKIHKKLNFNYSFSSEETETGGRLINARGKLRFPFIFLYGDVFLPLTKLDISQYKNSNSNLVGCYIGEFRNKSRNLRFKESLIVKYDNSKKESNDAINCGYFLIQQETFKKIIQNKSLEDSVLKKSNKFAPVICHSKYYTVGNIDRFPQIENFFDPKPTLLMDRDGTLTKRLAPGKYLQNYSKKYLKKGVINYLKENQNRFKKLIIVTNQPAVGNKKLSLNQMHEVNFKFLEHLRNNNIFIDAIFVCTHGWQDVCECRKPGIKLFLQAQHIYDINFKNSYYVGDMDRDEQCATKLDIKFIKISENVNFYDTMKKVIGL